MTPRRVPPGVPRRRPSVAARAEVVDDDGRVRAPAAEAGMRLRCARRRDRADDSARIDRARPWEGERGEGRDRRATSNRRVSRGETGVDVRARR